MNDVVDVVSALSDVPTETILATLEVKPMVPKIESTEHPKTIVVPSLPLEQKSPDGNLRSSAQYTPPLKITTPVEQLITTVSAVPYPKEPMPVSMKEEIYPHQSVPQVPVMPLSAVPLTQLDSSGSPSITKDPALNIVKDAIPSTSVPRSSTAPNPSVIPQITDKPQAASANVDELRNTAKTAVNAYNFGPPAVSVANLLTEDDGQTVDFA